MVKVIGCSFNPLFRSLSVAKKKSSSKKPALTPEEVMMEAIFGSVPASKSKGKTSSSNETKLEERIQKVLEGLTEREQEIIKLRYGVGTEDGQTFSLDHVAKHFGTTRDKIRKEEVQAIQKLPGLDNAVPHIGRKTTKKTKSTKKQKA